MNKEYPLNPGKNYEKTRQEIGYVNRKAATQEIYDRIGFRSGLEVHQQLRTRHKLFCKCPAGIYQAPEEYDAELIRHMRPTLSELGEYDGTALMEFKTRKEIIYRISNETACTYDVDDTPPFSIDREALDIAIEISLLSRLNIVGEVHITRKQYLDGSIPTGFQRTGIIGVEGEIDLKNKKIRLIQLSLEEDSCREVSDIRHTRIYRTDRLGMPLIETVTYPDCTNPEEVREACDYIRFLNRSTGKVRTGIGTGRQDVNVSCRGGSRVEIKGVSHTSWIPELTHNECFRQWALLSIRDKLKDITDVPEEWKLKSQELHRHIHLFPFQELKEAHDSGQKIIGVNLPGFRGILSHFTQPGQCFADEILGRLKVIACLELPFMIHSESQTATMPQEGWIALRNLLDAGDEDAQLIVWGPEEDMATAVESVEERCRMAFTGVPNETRKSFENGTTIFERVLPGADRMYPDTDSVPIPLTDNYIDKLKPNVPEDVITRYHRMKEWGIPEDTYTFIHRRNLYPLIRRIIEELGLDAVFTGAFMGHHLKFVEGHYIRSDEFHEEMIFDLLKFLRDQDIHEELAQTMLPVLFEHPKMDFDSILTSIGFKKISREKIISGIPFLKRKFAVSRRSDDAGKEINWIMGELRKQALGNIGLAELSLIVRDHQEPK
ncbi:MAG: Glu-tRNA(Gln) amidotransferase subunit GatE [Bacteroidales bacterium]|nr:Glu-tRNA(Gln) amidotransferase subunit GatE [Bacteroidales bacterium]